MPSRVIGSIASSGRPPFPQIARTPYCAPSPSVKRTMRAEVVVPMQIFSYLPGPSLRTPGAVCRRKAPLRSIGGATPWSKIRICVRSRMPIMWPSTVTSSPARSSRIASSVVGKVSALELTVELNLSVCGDVCACAASGPALVVDRDRVQRHVRVRVLDVTLQNRDVSAEAHRADARLVQQLIQLLFELRDVRIGVARADRARNGLLGEIHRVVGAAADADADDAGRARLATGADDRLENELLHALDAVGGDAHLQETHVFATRSLRHALDIKAVPVGDELPVHDRQAVAGVRSGVLARDRVHGVRAQRMFDGGALRACLEGSVNSGRMQGKTLADATRVDGDSRVLADEVLLALGDVDVLENRLQHALSGHRCLALGRIGERVT